MKTGGHAVLADRRAEQLASPGIDGKVPIQICDQFLPLAARTTARTPRRRSTNLTTRLRGFLITLLAGERA
jgi:hypothetical protein